jgi:hypothetical protein
MLVCLHVFSVLDIEDCLVKAFLERVLSARFLEHLDVLREVGPFTKIPGALKTILSNLLERFVGSLAAVASLAIFLPALNLRELRVPHLSDHLAQVSPVVKIL